MRATQAKNILVAKMQVELKVGVRFFLPFHFTCQALWVLASSPLLTEMFNVFDLASETVSIMIRINMFSS